MFFFEPQSIFNGKPQLKLKKIIKIPCGDDLYCVETLLPVIWMYGDFDSYLAYYSTCLTAKLFEYAGLN